MVARRFLIRGLVQGVGFRYFVTRAAADLRLSGWTRNLPDGGVEVVAQGPPAALERLGERLAAGPRLARVEAIEMFEVRVDASLEGFEVRY